MSRDSVRVRVRARVWLPIVLGSGCCACGHVRPVSDPVGQCLGGGSTENAGFELIVKPVPGQSLEVLDTELGIFAKAGVSRCDPHPSASGLCRVHMLEPGSPRVTIEKLLTFGAGKIAYAVPNVRLKLGPLPPPKPGTVAACPALGAAESGCQTPSPVPTAKPLDRCFDKQSQLIALRAPDAWSAPMPLTTDCSARGRCPTVITALVDTGVQPHHEDLECNLVGGRDFSCNADDCGTQTDDHEGHGTHMAGIIAASANAVGVRGVGWNTELMPLKVDVEELITNDWQAGAAIDYAVGQGASVINMSWSSPCPTLATYEAIKRAGARGVMVVSAPGNDGVDIEQPGNEQYPALYDLPNTVTVMSYSKGFKPTVSSNWGAHSVDLAAPGGAYTTQKCDDSTLCYAEVGDDTSTATAYVSGAAALIKSRHPDWGAEWIKTLLMDSAVPEKALRGMSRSGARLSLQRALVGPLKVREPVEHEHWDPLVHEVKWSVDYRTSLCQSVNIDITTDQVSYQRVLTDTANTGQAMVQVLSLDGPPPLRRVWLRVSCEPGGFQALSDEFWFDSP